MAGADRRREAGRGPDRPNSRRLRRRGNFCDSNRESARRESDRDGLNTKPGSTQGTWRGCGDRLHKDKFEEVAKDVDVVLDSVGKDTLARSYGVVKKGGFIVSLVARPDPAELEKYGIKGGSLSVEPNAGELAEIGRLIDVKKIRPIVSMVIPLAEAGKAQEQAATGHTRGKIVLEVADEP